VRGSPRPWHTDDSGVDAVVDEFDDETIDRQREGGYAVSPERTSGPERDLMSGLLPADVVCVGGITADLLARPVDELPRFGRLSLVDTVTFAPGGCAHNCASALARLGTAVRLVGRVGPDPLGTAIVPMLHARGVITDGVAMSPDVGTSTSLGFVAADGERAFVHSVGANGRIDAADLDWGAMAASRILFVGQFGLPGPFDDQVPAVLAEARRRGLRTALDTVWDPTGALAAKVRPCLPHLDYFMPSHPEAEAITGLADPPEIAASLQAQGVGVVVIKLGREGCYVADVDGGRLVAGFEVEQVDATGAGDAWNAGFMRGLLEGDTAHDAVRLGNAVGACCVQAIGAYDGIRSYADTRAFMGVAKVVTPR
jgi:sugar/nucleoside kinase (ribokinase family)